MNWIAQIFSVAGMILNITSFLQKSHKNVLILQFFGAVFFTASFFMLGAPTGACLNLVAVFRAIVYTNKERLHTDSKWWLMGFTSLYIMIFAATFLIFGKEATAKNFIVELLPVIAMTFATFSFSLPKAGHIRSFALISSPLWLIYNIINSSIGGILCEMFSIVSVVIGILYHDRKKTSQKTIFKKS